MSEKINIVIDKGATFAKSFNALTDDNGTVIDLSTYTATAKMKKSYSSTASYTFAVTLANTGVITLRMANTVTTNIKAGRYVYDVRLVDGSNTVSRPFEGVVTVTPNVT